MGPVMPGLGEHFRNVVSDAVSSHGINGPIGPVPSIMDNPLTPVES